jgi:HEAT repeat protein
MSNNGPGVTPDARDFFFLLRALLSSNDADIDLIAQRNSSSSLSETQAFTRIYLLTKQLNIPDAQVADVAKQFGKIVLADESKISRAQLLAAIESSVSQPAEPLTPLRQYEEKVLDLLSQAPGFMYAEEGQSPELDKTPLTQQWPREILESRAWNSIESPVPGIPDLPLVDTWVNLTLRELKTRYFDPAHALESEGWNELSFDREGVGVSLLKAVGETRGLTVIIGLPGAGKSTLMKWIARYLIIEPDCPFGIPISISLRQYAKEKARDPDLSLLDYFLHSRGIKDPGQLARWRNLIAFLLDPPHLESDTAGALLWLLDGWDEVPFEMRDRIMPEIQSIALYPSIITTRYSGDPLRLPAQQYYEIQGLKHGAALDFSYRWLVKTGNEPYYAAIENGLAESADLRRLARSPFILTLLCALATRPVSGNKPGLPRRGGGVLRETLNLIFAQHNADQKQAVKFGGRDREDVSRFAFWLLAEAPEGPRYVFDALDFEEATSQTGLFETLLVPSRLIARPSVDSTDFQFLHASFQEYLAAQTLSRDPERIPRHGTLLLDPAWKEVARFLAEMTTEDTNAWRVLWEEARQAVQDLDNFGIIASRISLLLAAADERDGGKRILGVDLRDHLWKVMKRYPAQVPTPLLQAFLELDATDLARRILDHRIREGKNSIVVSWLEHISVFDLEVLFTDHEKYRKVLAIPEVGILCPELPNWVFDRKQVEDDPAVSSLLVNLDQAIVGRDAHAVKDVLWTIIQQEDLVDVAIESIQELLRLPDDVAGESLLEIATSESVDVLIRGQAVSSLIKLGDKHACHQIIAFLASREMDDSAIGSILANLDDYPIDSREATLVLEFLERNPDPQTRCAAAELLPNARAKHVAPTMIAALKNEADEEVRLAILEALGRMADDFVIDKLWDLRETTALKSNAEWESWFEAVLKTLEQRQRRAAAFGSVPAADAIAASIRDWAMRALSFEADNQFSKLAYSVLKFPAILGRIAGNKLIEIARNKLLPEKMRLAALHGLSRVNESEVIRFLSGVAKERKQDWPEREKQAACDALGQISPSALSKLKTKQAKVAMARLAFRHNTLFGLREDKSGVSPTATMVPVATKSNDQKVRILLFSANPEGANSLKLAEEEREIKEKIRASEHRDLIDVETMGAVRPVDLLEGMNRYQPHVVQFSGHSNQGEGILICGKAGESKVIDGEGLAALFRSTEKNVLVVVLNACYSQEQAEAITKVVPCVVAMKDTIDRGAARSFAASFYSALGYGNSVARAFEQGLARLKMEGDEIEGVPQSEVPVLLTRSGVNAAEIFPVNPS